MAYQRILVEREDSVGIITLNRPEILDVINRKLGAELLDAVKVLEADDATGCLAITGAGEKTLPGRVRELHRHCPRQIMMTSDLSWIGEHHHDESGYRQLAATSRRPSLGYGSGHLRG